ncbi:hypothetical protein V1512DRAFT_107189 [Lipomyces arxii]|uniref:uncharacterized protein n=1 Tax=Lipomyces arxii TaxID=56418 RepID=UPI0034CDDC44
MLIIKNFHLLKMLCSHFHLVVASSHKNRMTLTNLVLILCPTLRVDGKFLSWIVDDVEHCFGSESNETMRSNERAAIITETKLALDKSTVV